VLPPPLRLPLPLGWTALPTRLVVVVVLPLKVPALPLPPLR
jgi:hypothetical protein